MKRLTFVVTCLLLVTSLLVNVVVGQPSFVSSSESASAGANAMATRAQTSIRERNAGEEQMNQMLAEVQERVQAKEGILISEDTANKINKPDEIPGPNRDLKHNYMVMLKCALSFDHEEIRRIEGDDATYAVIRVRVGDISKLAQDECVDKFADEHALDAFMNHVRNNLREEAQSRIRSENMQKTRGIPSYNEMKDHLEEQAVEDNLTLYAPERYYQAFVTPGDEKIRGLALRQTREQLFLFIQQKTWMSDFDLFGVREKWIKPIEFIYETPLLEANPIEEIASDCSEQANTLVSLLRASGVPADVVRVALGKVNFGGTTAGHAWVEIKEDGKWMVLDPTAGPYYIEGELHMRNGLPYKYWQIHEYPIEQVWVYYNDKYYMEGEDENAPISWDTAAMTNVDLLLLAAESSGPSGGSILLPLVGIAGVVVFLIFQEKKKGR